MRTLLTAIVVALTSVSASADVVSDVNKCRTETDSGKRLACFDAIAVASEAAPGAEATPKKEAIPVVVTKAVLRHVTRDPNKRVYNPRIDLVPTIRNDSKKTLVATEVEILINDAFGDRIFGFRSKLDIKVPAGKTAESDLYWSWDDNQFIPDEPFDKLLGPVKTGVAKATVTITKAVFSDGSIESY